MRLPIDHQAIVPAPTRPTWSAPVALAGWGFIAIGIAVVGGALALDPLRNVDVLSAGVTLGVAGVVLRALGSPVGHRN